MWITGQQRRMHFVLIALELVTNFRHRVDVDDRRINFVLWREQVHWQVFLEPIVIAETNVLA